jgi:hypothetical protein
MKPVPLVEGQYVVEVTEAEENDGSNDHGSYTMYQLRTTVVTGPTQEDGREPDGRMFFDSTFYPEDDYENPNVNTAEMQERAINELKARAIAAGVEDEDGYDHEAMVGKMYGVRIKHRMQTDRDTGEERAREQAADFFPASRLIEV